jgi:hypothetical protein
MHDGIHKSTIFAFRPRQCFAWLAVAVIALAPGCVRRRLLIRSNPPGAMAYVDNQPIGTTPCAASFVYYGTREIRLVKAGYETLTIEQPMPAPWYEIPPLDFFSENVAPKEIQDYRTVTYNMTPQVIHPTDQLMARAEQLRLGAQQGAALPATAVVEPAAPALNPPTITSPAVAIPGPTGPVLAPPQWGPEAVTPGFVVPAAPGPGVLPPGGRALEPLPAPR